MRGLEQWIIERMAEYKLGGAEYRAAARFAYREIRAVYRGRHWTNGLLTKPPEGVLMEEALKRAESAIRELAAVYGEAAEPKTIVKTKKELFTELIQA
jgi:hypothetical protein